MLEFPASFAEKEIGRCQAVIEELNVKEYKVLVNFVTVSENLGPYMRKRTT